MNPSDERLKNILVLVAVGCVFAYMADISWLKWSDMVIDSGREIYLPKALAGGRLLYRDIHYVYGPFSPYFNALLYKIFGVGVVTIGVGGLVNVALALLLVYVFAKFYVDRWMALLVTLSFLLIYPFGFYSGANIFNYVIPYSYPAVHSLLFSLAGFIFFRKWLADGSGRSGALAGFFLFLTGITKVEVALWLLAGLSFGFILKGKRERRGFFHLRTGSAKYVLLPVAAAALVYGSFKFAAWDSGGASPSLLELMKSNLLMPRGSFASGLFWGKEDFMETLKTLGAASAVMAGGGILAVAT